LWLALWDEVGAKILQKLESTKSL